MTTTPDSAGQAEQLPMTEGDKITAQNEAFDIAEAIATRADAPRKKDVSTLTAQGGDAVAHRWIRDGEAAGCWVDGKPTERQMKAAQDCAHIARWTVEYAYTTPPAPSSYGVDDAMVERACAAAYPWWSYYAIEDDRARARARMRAALETALLTSFKPSSSAVTDDERAVIETLLNLAYAAWCLADGTEDAGDESLGVDRADFAVLERHLDKAAKARWELRRILTTEQALTSTAASGGDEMPDDTKVICPACCHQFRGIPTQVQGLMIAAGFEPPFMVAPAMPDGFVMVPRKMFVEASAWEAASFAFGGPSTGEGEEYMDCTLWIGEIEGDDGQMTHGLHVSCDECPEEGSITLSEFAAASAGGDGNG